MTNLARDWHLHLRQLPLLKAHFIFENIVKDDYRYLKARYIEVKKGKKMSRVGWDNEMKMITFDPITCFMHTEVSWYKFIKKFVYLNVIYISRAHFSL